MRETAALTNAICGAPVCSRLGTDLATVAGASDAPQRAGLPREAFEGTMYAFRFRVQWVVGSPAIGRAGGGASWPESARPAQIMAGRFMWAL